MTNSTAQIRALHREVADAPAHAGTPYRMTLGDEFQGSLRDRYLAAEVLKPYHQYQTFHKFALPTNQA